MPSFAYTAKDSSGGTVKGTLDAASRKLAIQQLSAKRLRPLAIKESQASSKEGGKGGLNLSGLFSASGASAKPKTISPKVALPFLQALKELLQCGIQAGDALRLMSARLNDPGQKALASALWDEVRQGRSLSSAFARHPKVFDESVTSLVEAGEATGSLNNVLTRVVSSIEERNEIKAKLTSAMAYPLFLIFVSICLVALFLFFMLPKIQGLLGSLGGKLPFSTRLLIFISDWLINYGWIAGLACAGVVFGIVSWRRRPKGRMKFDALVLRIPGVGDFIRDNQILRLTQTLSLLLENGITMVQSLAMSERSLSNLAMRQSFAEARGKVTEGASLSAAFKGTGYFNDMSLDIFTVGENTGNVIPGLKQMTRQYSGAIDSFIKSFLGIFSVAVLLFVFAFVGLIAFGIISSVFQLSSSLSAG